VSKAPDECPKILSTHRGLDEFGTLLGKKDFDK
jgi:hypothetical protein